MECKFGVFGDDAMRQTGTRRLSHACLVASIFLGGNPKQEADKPICLFFAGPARWCFFRDFAFKRAVFRLPALHESPRRLFRCSYRAWTFLTI
ncbi:hypothetical protein TGAM01_v204787 [Trichoderma gamsii]|uniref:Uncharacterized protein n=1 Tax=Trichoderma gamsii TaxID=398673 RepID=A0A2P4ZPV3_9HYPO|nr:hypothetical protein TGAM01_v204787 [Trichoderma gamsii]PON26311.1 hypothetical protein TGAM01_v204787 [Trichoderma gamsii]